MSKVDICIEQLEMNEWIIFFRDSIIYIYSFSKINKLAKHAE